MPQRCGRIRSLAIPPAWTQVWICPQADGHIQATGRDAKGPQAVPLPPALAGSARRARNSATWWNSPTPSPRSVTQVDADLRRRGLPREKVLATVVRLLETTLIRVGNDDYAKQNRSYGLTTLRDAPCRRGRPRTALPLQGQERQDLAARDHRPPRRAHRPRLPGAAGAGAVPVLDEADGTLHDVTSADVNAYLREVAGQDITAKDFRTWAGTVLAALALQEFQRFDSHAAAKRNIKAAIERVASRLGNTPTICRKCYVHPAVLDCYLNGKLALEIEAEARAELRESLGRLQPEEAAVLALLLDRLRRMGEAPS